MIAVIHPEHGVFTVNTANSLDAMHSVAQWLREHHGVRGDCLMNGMTTVRLTGKALVVQDVPALPYVWPRYA